MMRIALTTILLLHAASGATEDYGAQNAPALIAQLGDDNFDLRESAQANLEMLGSVAVPQLMQTVAASDDPEVVSRCRKALETIAFEVKIAAAKTSGDVEGLITIASEVPSARRPMEVLRVCRTAREALTGMPLNTDAERTRCQELESRIEFQELYAEFAPGYKPPLPFVW